MRVFFLKKGQQRKFINRILSKISVKEAAKLCNLSERTIRDWRREKFSLDLGTLHKLCRRTGILFPSNVELKNDYWYVAHGSSVGGLAVLKKYGRIGGDPEYRKKKWYEWWEREGKYINRFFFKRKLIRKPKQNINLAEFIGIMLSDGSITPKQVQISLNKKTEKEYIEFVKCLIKKLFKLNSGINYKKGNGMRLQTSSKELVDYLLKLGLNQGKGQKPRSVPQWILKNLKYQIACLRGLMDTEGCVFPHRYKVNGKLYSYKKIAFKNNSYPLIKFVYNFLKNIGLHHPRIAKNLKEVRIESKDDVQKYFQLVGFHNSKNLKRYKN